MLYKYVGADSEAETLRLMVTIDVADITSEYFAECCGQGCGVHGIEEMSQCVGCGQQFCMKHDCECPVDISDEDRFCDRFCLRSRKNSCLLSERQQAL